LLVGSEIPIRDMLPEYLFCLAEGGFKRGWVPTRHVELERQDVNSRFDGPRKRLIEEELCPLVLRIGLVPVRHGRAPPPTNPAFIVA
jgi:hypothetical protein